MKMYRVVSEKEFQAVMGGKIINCSKLNTQGYSKGKKGVFFFPRIPQGDIKNSFFIPWAQGKNTMVIIADIPCNRVIAHGNGQYADGVMPELLVDSYGREDVRSYIPLTALYDAWKDKTRQKKIGRFYFHSFCRYDSSQEGFIEFHYYNPRWKK